MSKHGTLLPNLIEPVDEFSDGVSQTDYIKQWSQRLLDELKTEVSPNPRYQTYDTEITKGTASPVTRRSKGIWAVPRNVTVSYYGAYGYIVVTNDDENPYNLLHERGHYYAQLSDDLSVTFHPDPAIFDEHEVKPSKLATSIVLHDVIKANDTFIGFIPDYNLRVDLLDKLKKLFKAAEHESFENGVETSFSKAITELVELHGVHTTDILSACIDNGSMAPSAMAEALMWIGRMDDTNTQIIRRELLTHALFAKSDYVRDGAIAGLMYLDDPSVFPSLERAIKTETVTTLKGDLQNLIRRLKTL